MLRTHLLRHTSRAVAFSATAPRAGPTLVYASKPTIAPVRLLSLTANLREKDAKKNEPGLSVPNAEGEEDHHGQYARTDPTVQVEYPEDHDFPRSDPVQGRGGMHFKRTLASFSLEGNVGVVTGGARGLGLVMSQALVISGADVAIVDLES